MFSKTTTAVAPLSEMSMYDCLSLRLFHRALCLHTNHSLFIHEQGMTDYMYGVHVTMQCVLDLKEIHNGNNERGGCEVM